MVPHLQSITTLYPLLTMYSPSLVKCHMSISRCSKDPTGRPRIRLASSSSKTCLMKVLFQSPLPLCRSTTLKFSKRKDGSKILKVDGFGNYLFFTTSTLSHEPILHLDPFSMTSLPPHNTSPIKRGLCTFRGIQKSTIWKITSF